jgi:HAMP domain-containing protein
MRRVWKEEMRKQHSPGRGVLRILDFRNRIKTMKTPQNRIGKLLGTLVLGGWMASPALLSAQEFDPRPGPPPPREDMVPGDMPQDRRLGRVRGQIDALHRMGKHDEAMQLERRIQAATSGAHMMMPPRDGAKAERKPKIQGERRKDAAPVPPREKIQHLKQAAEHLQAAGYVEYAQKARQEIGRIMEQARHEAKPDINAAMKEEMDKLRKEMEELRQQIRRMKAEVAPKHDQAPPKEHRPE